MTLAYLLPSRTFEHFCVKSIHCNVVTVKYLLGVISITALLNLRSPTVGRLYMVQSASSVTKFYVE